MERSLIGSSTASIRHPSPRKQEIDDFNGFLFVPDDDEMSISYELTPTKSPLGSPFRNTILSTVMSALVTVATSENLLVTNIAKSVIAGAASKLTTSAVGGVPGVAVGALLVGGIAAYKALRSKSAKDILMSLSPQQQKQLIMRLKNGLRVHGVRDLANEISSRGEVREIALGILNEFLEEKYGLKIMRSY